jgi:hypothetical protein
MDVCGQIHVPAAILPGNNPRYTLNMRLGGPHTRFELFGYETKYARQASPLQGCAIFDHCGEGKWRHNSAPFRPGFWEAVWWVHTMTLCCLQLQRAGVNSEQRNGLRTQRSGRCQICGTRYTPDLLSWVKNTRRMPLAKAWTHEHETDAMEPQI